MGRQSILHTVCAVILLGSMSVGEAAAAGSSGPSWSVSAILAPLFAQPASITSIDGEQDIWGIEPVSQRRPERDTTLTLTHPSAPQKFYLGQNSPNPFRAATSISYGLPAPTWVRISIHSMLGSQIMALVDEPQKAGVYTVEFSEPDLKPGVYFYRIETDYGVLTRRMTIAR